MHFVVPIYYIYRPANLRFIFDLSKRKGKKMGSRKAYFAKTWA
mgnify:CR=1 FL=1